MATMEARLAALEGEVAGLQIRQRSEEAFWRRFARAGEIVGIPLEDVTEIKEWLECNVHLSNAFRRSEEELVGILQTFWANIQDLNPAVTRSEVRAGAMVDAALATEAPTLRLMQGTRSEPGKEPCPLARGGTGEPDELEPWPTGSMGAGSLASANPRVRSSHAIF